MNNKLVMQMLTEAAKCGSKADEYLMQKMLFSKDSKERIVAMYILSTEGDTVRRRCEKGTMRQGVNKK